jgi:hypothetical protein
MPGSGNLNPIINANKITTQQLGMRGRGSQSAASTASLNKAPTKANNAPKPSVNTIGTGLIAALNAEQLRLLNNRDANGKPNPLIEIADIYEIKFVDDIIATAGMVPAGDFDKTLAGGSSNLTAAQQLLPNKQSVDPTVRTRAARAGQQIVQFIDQVIRSSNYIIGQANVVWNTQTQQWESNGKPAQQFAWYNIVVQVQALGYDRKRRDHAYRMTFVVVPYETPMLSTFFPAGQFRGVHKNYNYWFTGQNTQVLQFEQSFNHQWTQAVTNDIPAQQNESRKVNTREQWKTQVFSASGQSSQGAEQRVYESGANAADFLYSSDLASVKLTVIGDPAWMPSPLMDTVEQSFTTSAFFPDGAINTQASSAYFSVAWNRPTDYNLQTGLLDPGTQNYFADRDKGIAGISREATTYVATKITHIFRGGRFTQEIEGQWAQYNSNTAATDAGRPVKTPADNQSRLPPFDPGSGSNTGKNAWENTRRDGITALASQTVGPANNEVASGRITAVEAKNLLTPVNGVAISDRDLQAFGGRAYLQSIIDGTTNAKGTPTAPQKIAKNGGPG